MLISAPKARFAAEMAALSAARIPVQPPAAGEIEQARSYDAAFAVLGIRTAITKASSSAASRAASPAGNADPAGRLVRLAVFYEQQLDAVRARNPEISEANARRIAQRETIVANRSAFPPGSLFLYTELGEWGSSMSDPPEDPTVTAAVKSRPPPPPPGALFGFGDATLVPAPLLEDRYTEWVEDPR